MRIRWRLLRRRPAPRNDEIIIDKILHIPFDKFLRPPEKSGFLRAALARTATVVAIMTAEF